MKWLCEWQNGLLALCEISNVLIVTRSLNQKYCLQCCVPTVTGRKIRRRSSTTKHTYIAGQVYCSEVSSAVDMLVVWCTYWVPTVLFSRWNVITYNIGSFSDVNNNTCTNEIHMMFGTVISNSASEDFYISFPFPCSSMSTANHAASFALHNRVMHIAQLQLQ